MAQPGQDTIDTRQKFVEAWNNTMIDIWMERISLLGVVHTGNLLRSPDNISLVADERFYTLAIEQQFLEYGLWQDLGVGRELQHGQYERNRAYIEEHGRPREARRWFSVKYYSSVMRLRDFLAQSLGDEFRSIFCASLDSDKMRAGTEFYRRKGYTR